MNSNKKTFEEYLRYLNKKYVGMQPDSDAVESESFHSWLSISISNDQSSSNHLHDTYKKLYLSIEPADNCQENKLNVIGRSAVGIAHDLKNLLFAITAYADLAASHLEKNSPESNHLESLFTVTSRANELVGQILSYARPKEMSHTFFHLKNIADEVRKTIVETAPNTLRIENVCNCRHDIIKGNEIQIYQCFMNLAINAIHAMNHEGTLRFSIGEQVVTQQKNGVIGTLDQGNYLVVNVTDTGPGISPSKLKQIFEPFYSTKPRDKGTGLGLSLIFDIVKSHQGNIEIRSSPQCGTQFKLYFPTPDIGAIQSSKKMINA